MVSSASGRLLSLRGLAEYHPVNDAATTIISVETPSDDASPQSVAHGRGSALQALTTLTLVLCVLLTLLWGKQYARHWLLWLDSQDRETVCLVFLIMYTLVAFPLTWGYILLNFACGYHFGLVLGVAVTAGAATFGISVAHTVMKRFFLGFIMARLLSSDVVRSTLALLDTGHAFKVVIISRLTPIPFGLQNAMFAVSQSHMTPTTPPCFSSDLKLHLQSTDYGSFLANEASPLTVSVIDDKLREKLVVEFRHLRNHAVEPLATFLDYITYSYMIDNIILLITGTLHQRPIGELIPKCHPLGSFDQMEAIHIASTPAELYNAVIVDTPLAPFFVDCISEQDLDEMNIEIIRNTLYKAYLEAFYKFCENIGGTTADVMLEILAVRFLS
ncbi:unnamed protein product [Ixodes pacificus]